jgi:N-methylhydantoinase A
MPNNTQRSVGCRGAGDRELADKVPGFVEKLDEVIHGTTLVINAIIERKGARTGLITTKGFRDVLELGREIRYAPYDIFSEYPKPLVPRRYRTEVDERVRSDGTILKPLDPDEAAAVVRTLVDQGIESIAVCLINSFENPDHELMIEEIIKRRRPRSPSPFPTMFCPRSGNMSGPARPSPMPM